MLFVTLVPVVLSLTFFLRLYMILKAHEARITDQNRNTAWNNNTFAMEQKPFATFLVMPTRVTLCMVRNWVVETLYNIDTNAIQHTFENLKNTAPSTELATHSRAVSKTTEWSHAFPMRREVWANPL